MTMQSQSLQNLLRWNRETGSGYFPVDQWLGGKNPYDEAYFQKYVGYENTTLGVKLTEARKDLVDSHYKGLLLDVGIGSGQFLKARQPCVGFDVNPIAVDWLRERKIYVDPTLVVVEAASFWDSLEHIKYPSEILKNVRQYVFVTIPLFTDYSSILNSKHFRPDEHYHYFTQLGFVSFMWNNGFRKVAENKMEQVLGREDVFTFVFKRK